MLSLPGQKENEVSGILVGDELGQIKRIDVTTGAVRTINKHLVPDLPAPDKPVLTIRGFREPCLRTAMMSQTTTRTSAWKARLVLLSRTPTRLS